MRHLKSINEDNESKISKFINWDLISDAKELSLDYLDEGLCLLINVRGDTIFGDGILFYKESFSHDPARLRKEYINTRLITKHLKYKFVLIDNNMMFDSRCDEFVNILKEIYPNEKIVTINKRGFKRIKESKEIDNEILLLIEIKKTMEEILLEIYDLGYDVFIDISNFRSNNILLTIGEDCSALGSGDYSYFEPPIDFIPCLEHLLYYAKSERFGYSIWTIFDYEVHNTYTLKTLNDMFTDGLINQIKISFKK